MKYKIIHYIKTLIIVFSICGFTINQHELKSICPKKIHWKKLKTETEVLAVLSGCIPQYADHTFILNFLKNHHVRTIVETEGIIYANVLTKSKSMWIEKQWMMEFVLDEHKKLKEIKVKVGLTGP